MNDDGDPRAAEQAQLALLLGGSALNDCNALRQAVDELRERLGLPPVAWPARLPVPAAIAAGAAPAVRH